MVIVATRVGTHLCKEVLHIINNCFLKTSFHKSSKRPLLNIAKAKSTIKQSLSPLYSSSETNKKITTRSLESK